MKRIKVKAELCAGCRQCEMVCSFEHFTRFSPSLSRVTVHKDDRNGLDYPVTCRHVCDLKLFIVIKSLGNGVVNPILYRCANLS